MHEGQRILELEKAVSQITFEGTDMERLLYKNMDWKSIDGKYLIR